MRRSIKFALATPLAMIAEELVELVVFPVTLVAATSEPVLFRVGTVPLAVRPVSSNVPALVVLVPILPVVVGDVPLVAVRQSAASAASA
jgi:hypothetical protein